jgi:hypothetical protein
MLGGGDRFAFRIMKRIDSSFLLIAHTPMPMMISRPDTSTQVRTTLSLTDTRRRLGRYNIDNPPKFDSLD